MDICTPRTLLHAGWMVMMSLLTVMSPITLAQQMCDQCNCHISTSDADSHAIRNIGIVCNTGTLKWYGADGGLLLELSPFIHGNFKACFLVESDQHTFVKFSREISRPAPPSRRQQQQQQPQHSRHRRSWHRRQQEKEESKRLRLEHLATSRGGGGREFCVTSTSREPVMLYVETERTPQAGSVPKVSIHYDMERISPPSNHGVSNSLDECRPCTKEEILDSYCSMDFAVIGSPSDIQDNLATDKTEISLAIKQVIHATQPVHFQRVKRSDPHLTGKVVMPRKCRVKGGTGDFLFTGRMRLGELTLKCAPYLHDWRAIQKEAECTHS